jgi:hypothetical protein
MDWKVDFSSNRFNIIFQVFFFNLILACYLFHATPDGVVLDSNGFFYVVCKVLIGDAVSIVLCRIFSSFN